MTAARIKAVLALVLMLGAFAGAQASQPTWHLADTRPKIGLAAIFPAAFGHCRIDDHMPIQLVSPDQAALLNNIYNQTLSRTYGNRGGERIMLSLAYGGDQSDATRAHRPEVCYPAQGSQIVSSRNGTVHTGTHPLRVRQLVAKQGGRLESMSYWITVGEQVTLSGTEQKLAQLSYSARGIIADGMLVRISTIDAAAAAAANAYKVHEVFVAQLARAVPVSPGAGPCRAQRPPAVR